MSKWCPHVGHLKVPHAEKNSDTDARIETGLPVKVTEKKTCQERGNFMASAALQKWGSNREAKLMPVTEHARAHVCCVIPRRSNVQKQVIMTQLCQKNLDTDTARTLIHKSFVQRPLPPKEVDDPFLSSFVNDRSFSEVELVCENTLVSHTFPSLARGSTNVPCV